MRKSLESKYKQRFESIHDLINFEEGSQIIFCMYSGGLDSLGMLYKLLTDMEYITYQIHVHHIHLMNAENRDKAERKAVDNTLAYFRKNPKYRKFGYSETTIKYPTYNKRLVLDVEVIYALGMLYINGIPEVKHLASGVTKTDRDSVSGGVNRFDRYKEVFEVLCKTGATRLFPVEKYTKEEIYQFLPKELSAMAWSCRTPIYRFNGTTTPCGKCSTCKQLQEIKREVQ
jgi:7-cyano-7-deazaguanine synthase in queuosine biosynthesis